MPIYTLISATGLCRGGFGFIWANNPLHPEKSRERRSLLYSAEAVLYHFRMSKAALLFQIAKQDGLEFVFTSGNALSYPVHTHISVYTITVVRNGVVRLTRKNSTTIYPHGSVYVVAPYEPHRPEYTDSFDIVSLCINKEHSTRMSRSSLTVTCLKYAKRLMEQNLLQADTVERLLDGITMMYESVADAGKSPIVPPKVLEAWDCRTIEHSDSAMPLHLSRYHFIRTFKSQTGLTPHQYRIQSRIREAKQLLRSEHSIVDAALLAGFYDQSHLNRWFTRSIGITPHQYKKSCFALGR